MKQNTKKWHVARADLHIKIAQENDKNHAKSWWLGAAYHFEQAGMWLNAKACRELAK